MNKNLKKLLHRLAKKLSHGLDSPVIKYLNGNKFWFKEYKSHRADGPAIEYANGDRSWYILNKELEEKEFNLWISRIRRFV